MVSKENLDSNDEGGKDCSEETIDEREVWNNDAESKRDEDSVHAENEVVGTVTLFPPSLSNKVLWLGKISLASDFGLIMLPPPQGFVMLTVEAAAPVRVVVVSTLGEIDFTSFLILATDSRTLSAKAVT